METMIAEVFVPAISRSFDFQLPASGIVGDVVPEMIHILEQTQAGLAFDRDNPLLCHVDDGRILNWEDSLAVAGVYDGVHLMLL